MKVLKCFNGVSTSFIPFLESPFFSSQLLTQIRKLSFPALNDLGELCCFWLEDRYAGASPSLTLRLLPVGTGVLGETARSSANLYFTSVFLKRAWFFPPFPLRSSPPAPKDP